MKIKGVNLGNWLVLEKWMSPALFYGTDAQDEYDLPRMLSKEVYEARIRVHRSEYISEGDFIRIRAMGLNTVRIPIPYFIFGDVAPYIGCIEELDKAFSWANRYGLKILIDLHTVPGGQNGFDNGGISGVCKWAQSQEKIAFGMANARLSEEQDKLGILLVRKADYEKQLKELTTGTLKLSEIRHCKDAITVMKTRIRDQMMEVRRAQKNLEEARRRLDEVMKERKTHENFKEKAFEEFKQELLAEESKQNDQLVSFTYHNKKED